MTGVREALPWVLLAALAVHAGAHLALVVRLGRSMPGVQGFLRALAALAVPPLAPLWGYRAGMRKATITWCTALAVYALGVALA